MVSVFAWVSFVVVPADFTIPALVPTETPRGSGSILQGAAACVFNTWFFAVASACPELTQPPSARLCRELPCDLCFTGAAVNPRAGRPRQDLSAERQGVSCT